MCVNCIKVSSSKVCSVLFFFQFSISFLLPFLPPLFVTSLVNITRTMHVRTHTCQNSNKTKEKRTKPKTKQYIAEGPPTHI